VSLEATPLTFLAALYELGVLSAVYGSHQLPWDLIPHLFGPAHASAA
jgi:hypothetical protein